MSVLLTVIKPQQAKAIAVVDDALIVSTLVTVAAAAGVAVVAGNAYKYWNNQLTAYKEANPDAADGLKGALQYAKWRLKNKDLKTNVAVTLGETAYTAAQKFFGWWQTESGAQPGSEFVDGAETATIQGAVGHSEIVSGSRTFKADEGAALFVVEDYAGRKFLVGVSVDGREDHKITVSSATSTSTFTIGEKSQSGLDGYVNIYKNPNVNYFAYWYASTSLPADIQWDDAMVEFLETFVLEGATVGETIQVSRTYNPTADETEDGVATPLQPLPATNEVEISLPVTTIPQTVVDSVDDSLVIPQEAYDELSLAIQDTVAKAVADAVPLAVEQSMAIAVAPPVAGEIEMQGDYTVGGLAGVFPFCIPFDLVNMMRSLMAGRKAPRIELPFVIPNLVDYTMVIDLSSFDSVASILRGMEFLAFAVGLAMVTRYLIKG